jgi:hypothetical protein
MKRTSSFPKPGPTEEGASSELYVLQVPGSSLIPEVLGPSTEKYAEFYANWVKLQEEYLHELLAALAGH